MDGYQDHLAHGDVSVHQVGVVAGSTAPGPTSLREVLVEDLTHMVAVQHGTSRNWWLEIAYKAVVQPRIRVVVLYRIGQRLAARRLLPLAYYLQARAVRAAGAEISPLSSLGPGLCLIHSVGIVVGAEVSAGRNLRIHHGVTLGDGGRPGQPKIGNDVNIGAGAKVLGPVSIGDRVVIGANAVVTTDIPADMIASGSPAQFRPQSERHAMYRR